MELGQVRFSSAAIGDVVAWLDETPTVPSGGYGGWTVEARDRRKGLTQFDGVEPIRMPIAIVFDDWIGNRGQEIAISRLGRMALPPNDWDEPPVVNVEGDAVPQPGPVDWVIESLRWGTAKVIWDFDSNGVMGRQRQDCVVNLLEYVDEDRVAFTNLAPGAGVVTGSRTSGGWPRQYITKSGDTLMKIAAAFYKDAAKWGKIAAANNIRDPRNVPPNTLLRIPKP